MIKRFLNRIMMSNVSDASVDAAHQEEAAVLPCIGKRSDLIPVNAVIERIVPSRASLSDTYEKIAIQVAKSVSYDRIAITLLDFEQETFRNVFVFGPQSDGIEANVVYDLKGSFQAEVANSRHAIRMDPSVDYPDLEAFIKSGVRSHIATPLITNDEVIGTLHLASYKPDGYLERDLDSLELAGIKIAPAIYNLVLVQAEQDRANQLEALYEVAATLAQPQTFEAKAQAIVETLVRISDADQAIVRRADEERGMLELVAVASLAVIEFEPTLKISDQHSASSRVFRDSRILSINDYQKYPEATPNMQKQGVGSVVVMPIRSGGRSLGILSVVSKAANHFDNKCVALLTAFADEIGIVFDTAELTDSLQASAARAQAVMDTAADGIITINQRGIIETFNPAAEAIFGYTVIEAIGQNVSLLVPEPEKGAHDGYLSKYLATGESKIIGKDREVEGRRKDGTTFPMDLSIGIVEVGDTKVFTGIIRDITERKITEARLNESMRLASVGELAAGVAHEINNPLAAIILASDLLSTYGLSDEASADLKVISDAAQRAARIVQNMLLFARKTDPDPERMTIDLVIQQALELKAHDFRFNLIDCHMEVETGLPNCLIDRHQMGQVIINVLNNAEHAMVTHRSGGNITIKIGSTSESVIVEVRDDGPGIEPDLMAKIFIPFFTTKPSGEGTGLGLSICHGILQQHCGEMWAESNQGAGTSFFMKLPISDDGPEPQPVTPQPQEAIDVPIKRLLVVDDESTILDLITRGLRDEIDVIDQANSGEAALEMIRSLNYDCILLDLRMPGISGMEVFDTIVASNPSLAGRIVFMTGDTASQESAAFLTGKQNPIIGKPFQLDQLRQIVESVISDGFRT